MTDRSTAHAEQMTLGTILHGADLDVARRTLPPADDRTGWTNEAHRTIWSAVCRVADRGEAVDLETVFQQLMDDDTLAIVGGPTALPALVASAPARSTLPYWANTVADRAHRRRMATAAHDVIAACADLDRDPAGAVVDLDAVLDTAPKQGGLLYHTANRLHLLPDPEWLVDGKITRGLTVMWGKPKSGKSFVALDLAAARAAGTDWHGMDVRPGRTMYVAGEGMHDAKARLGRALDARGASDVQRERVAVTAQPLDLSSHRDLALLDGACGDHAADLLVLDTWARVSGVDDENDNAQASAVIGALDRLRNRHDLDVIVVHHARKDGLDMRGASALLAALDTAVLITKDGHDVRAVASAIRGGPEWPYPVQWRLRSYGDSAVLELASDGGGSTAALGILDDGVILTHSEVRAKYGPDVLRHLKQSPAVEVGVDATGRPTLAAKPTVPF